MSDDKPTYIEIAFIDRDGRRLEHRAKFVNWKNFMEDLNKMDIDVVEELSDFVKHESKQLFKKCDKLHLNWGIVYEEGRAFGTEEQFGYISTEGNE